MMHPIRFLPVILAFAAGAVAAAVAPPLAHTDSTRHTV